MQKDKSSVVIIGPAYPLRGGLASFNERLCKAFTQNNYKASIYTFSLQYPSFLFPGTTQYSTEKAPENLNITVAINSINPFNWIKIGLQLKKQQPNIVVVRYWLPFMGPCLGTILRLVRLNKQTKIICIADNIIPHEKRFGDVAFTKYFIKPIDAFVTMSNKVQKDVNQLTSKPVQTIVHPLYDNFGLPISKKEARNYLNLHQQQPIILFFGFIRKYKGLDILLESMQLLQQKQSPIQLLVAGEFYDDQPFYNNLINQFQLKNLILHTKFISDSEVKYYLCAADFVIQPYRQATQSGVTPLAYHFEKPMLVTNVGGLPALVPDGKVGLIAEPNASDISKKIEQLYNLGEEYFLPHLRMEKQKYSWDVLVQTIQQLAN